MIFVTDGDPTAWFNKKKNPDTDYTRILNRLYNSETGSVNPYPGNFLTGEEIGNGFDYEEEAMQQAEIALRNISKMDAFYAVGVGTEGGYSHLGRLTNPVALPVGTETKPYFKGSNPKALARAFDDIANYMTYLIGKCRPGSCGNYGSTCRGGTIRDYNNPRGGKKCRSYLLQ